jgi:chromosome segregation ATPase
MSANPFDALVDSLSEEIVFIENEIARKTDERSAEQRRAADWQRKYDESRPNSRDPNDLAIVAQCNERIARLTSEINALASALAGKKTDLEKARQKRDAVDASADAAMANGVDPSTAYAGSVAEVTRAELIKKVGNVVIIILLFAAVIVAIAYWRKRNK